MGDVQAVADDQDPLGKLETDYLICGHAGLRGNISSFIDYCCHHNGVNGSSRSSLGDAKAVVMGQNPGGALTHLE